MLTLCSTSQPERGETSNGSKDILGENGGDFAGGHVWPK